MLAAGSGERLRPLTEDRPKPMIEIGGKPVLYYNLQLLARAGVREAVVNLHYLPDAITGYFGDGSALGMRISYVYEPVLLGTSGAARNVAERLNDGSFFVVYGDNLSTIDLGALAAFHREKNADLTLALFHRNDPRSSGIAQTGSDGRVTRFAEKPAEGDLFSHWVNAGYYVAQPQVLDAIPPAFPSDFGRDVFPAMLAAGARVYGYHMAESLWWIDSIEDYRRTKAAFEGTAPCP